VPDIKKAALVSTGKRPRQRVASSRQSLRSSGVDGGVAWKTAAFRYFQIEHKPVLNLGFSLK
jgi:hypothetical protein